MAAPDVGQHANGGTVDRASEIAEKIRGKIVRRELNPGDAMPTTSALTDAYGVSPPTMRAALRLLEAEGLLRVHRGARGGPRIEQLDTSALARQAQIHLRLDGAGLDDLHEALELIQPGAVELAAARRTDEQLEQLWTIVERLRASRTMSDFSDISTDFVLLLMEASGNPAVKLFAIVIGNLIRQEIHRQIDEQEMGSAAEYHASRFSEVVHMIELKQGDAAAALWRAHLLITRPVPRRKPEPRSGEEQ